jgi:hypothetical protein
MCPSWWLYLGLIPTHFTGSPYTLYLGSSARIARLQAEHMRLCLNSYALKSAPEEDELIALCLKKALNAAMSTIQTHYESSQTDLALSFATDVSGIGSAQAKTRTSAVVDALADSLVQEMTSMPILMGMLMLFSIMDKLTRPSTSPSRWRKLPCSSSD